MRRRRNDDPSQVTSKRSLWLVMSALMTCLLLSALDQTIVSTALPTIVGDLGGLDHISWVVTAYLLSSTVSVPDDVHGARRHHEPSRAQPVHRVLHRRLRQCERHWTPCRRLLR